MKTKIKHKLFFPLAFEIATIKLFASYTGASWIRGGAGIIFIILFKKKWWLTISGVVFDFNNFAFKVYSNEDALPNWLIDSVKFKSSVGLVWINKKYIFFQSGKLYCYTYKNGKIERTRFFDAVGFLSMQFIDSSAVSSFANSYVYRFDKLRDGTYTERKIDSPGYSITGSQLEGNKIYTMVSKRNHLASVTDLYHETNLKRLNIWRIGLTIFKNHPLFGVGDIDINKIYSRYKDYYLKEDFGHMHNNFVLLLVILAAFGSISVMFLSYRILRLNLRIYKTLKDVPFLSSYSLGVLAAFIGFLFSGLGKWNFGDKEIITVIWFPLGLNIAFCRNFMNGKNKFAGSNE